MNISEFFNKYSDPQSTNSSLRGEDGIAMLFWVRAYKMHYVKLVEMSEDCITAVRDDDSMKNDSSWQLATKVVM